MTKFEIFNNINNNSVRFPLLMSFELKSLVKGLLDKNPAKRMSWAQVSKCGWCKEVQYVDIYMTSDVFEHCRIIPSAVVVVLESLNLNKFPHLYSNP